jgi:rhodanese-related sulfurtransferase/CBS domain-containing protein
VPTEIGRDEVRRLLDAGAQLVEVLPREEYEEEHLPGAINLPLKALNRTTAGRLSRAKPVIVYCWDSVWDISPRAAWRLEAMGFKDVYEYVAGKADWLAAALPSEGTLATEPRAGSVARRDVPTCRLDDDLQTARQAAGEWATCMVVNEQGVLLGRLGRRALADTNHGPVEDAMTEGPSTVRPDTPVAKLRDRMRQRNLTSLPVTTSDGRFIGLLLREDAERLAPQTRDDWPVNAFRQSNRQTL